MPTTAIKDEYEEEVLLAAHIANRDFDDNLEPHKQERDAGYDADELTDEQREAAADAFHDIIVGDIPTAEPDEG